MNFGEKIKIERKNLKMTQQQLADEVGVTRKVIVSYEADKSSPRSHDVYVRLAKALQVDVNYLLTDDTQKKAINADFITFMDNLAYFNSDFSSDSAELEMWHTILCYLDTNCPSLSPVDHIAIANCIGFIQNISGKYQEAVSYYDENIRQLKRISSDWVEYISSGPSSSPGISAPSQDCLRLADTTLYRFLYLLLSTHYRRARSLMRLSKYHEYEEAEFSLAVSHAVISFLQNSEVPELQEKEIQRKIAQYQLDLYNGSALFYRYKENFPLAEKYIKRAIEGRMYIDNPGKQILDPLIEWEYLNPSARTAEYFNTFGQITYAKGCKEAELGEKSIQASIEYYRISERMREKLDPRNPALTESYNNLGKAYEMLITVLPDTSADTDTKRQEYFQRSLDYHNKALEFKRRPYYANRYRLSITYKNIGSLYKTVKRYPESLEYYRKALEIRKEFRSEKDEAILELNQLIKEIESKIES